MAELSGWENFYVIVGSSAGALIGLQFVVMTLIADMPIREDLSQAGSAFATPTILHFGAVLLLAGIMSAPWHAIAPVAILWGMLGTAGVVYDVLVARRARTQTVYKPELEDWLFHVVLPFVAYMALGVCALASRTHASSSLFGVAGASLLLLFIGIHNAWDAVTYHIYVLRRKQSDAERQSE